MQYAAPFLFLMENYTFSPGAILICPPPTCPGAISIKRVKYLLYLYNKRTIYIFNRTISRDGHCSSVSAMKFWRTSRTPVSPATANPYTYGRPMRTAEAPRAIALIISAPLRMPLSNRTGTRPLTASHIEGRAVNVAIAPSSCRPP
jgi:hypothetical protein